MKTQWILSGVVAALVTGNSALALDCPNFSGKFGVVEYTDSNGSRSVDPAQVKIQVVQTGCTFLTLEANRVNMPEEKVTTSIRTDEKPVLYIARPEDSDGPEEYLSSLFGAQKLVSRILYLYEGNSQYHDTGATLTYDLDESGNLREVLLNADGHGGMRLVESFKTRRE